MDILEKIPQVVLVAEPKSVPETGQTDFFIEYANPAWELISGSLKNTIVGRFLSQTIYAKSSIPWCELAQSVLAEEKNFRQILFSELLEKWLDISITPLDGEYYCIFMSDVTDMKQGEARLKEQNYRLSVLSEELVSSRNNLKTKLEKIEMLNTSLEQLAYFDHLTGLPNRIRFNSIVEGELSIGSKCENRFAVAMLDIDNLKNVNDSIGHESGDELLCQYAQRLNTLAINGIQVSRFGGDEFLILVKNYDHEAELLHLLNTVLETLREPYHILNVTIKSTVSIGVATFPEDAGTVQELVKCADIAVTDAKRRGKNALSLFHSVMQENLLARITLEQKMNIACESGHFKMYYQPQLDLASGRLRGFEALIRWFDPDLGCINPEDFIPIAEENRMIIPLGEWILQTSCEQLRRWQEELGFTGIMSVNVSPIQLQYSGFIYTLRKVLESTGVPPETLEIEITEGILIESFTDSIKILEEIKELGIGISLDDFGTGYSSLSYLQFLPLTTLKIDRSFIANITQADSIEYEITNSIIMLVNKLGLDTIAEGVETPEQLEMVRQLNCKTTQGFLTGKPMPGIECQKMIQEALYSPV